MNSWQPLNLRPGDWVEVRSEHEILSTLDEQGALAGLVFMPEMLALCGRRMQVFKRADKTCDTIDLGRMLRLHDTVHLRGARCDGSAHGGCQAACLQFWHEGWLRRVDRKGSSASEANGAAVNHDGIAVNHNGIAVNHTGTPTRDRSWLDTTATVATADPAEPACFRCQATAIKQASTKSLKWWEPTQYVRDVRTNEVSVYAVVRSLVLALIDKVVRKLTGHGYPDVTGKLQRTPVEKLDLQPGEWVIVKSREEIQTTLDKTGRNRGMTFEPEMLPYCGKRYRVVQRVERIVDERSGRMKQLGNVGIILEDVICASAYRTPCPRANYLYWREIWLRRVEPHEVPQAADEVSCPLNAIA